MLPYWHGASIDFCAKPLPKPQQQQQSAATVPSSAGAANAWQSVSDSLIKNADKADATCETEAAASASNIAGCSWLDEDRLHSTTRMPTVTDEQRELDSRAATAEEQLLADRIAHIAEFDDLDLSSLTNWCDNTRDQEQRQTNASNDTCNTSQDQRCTNICEKDFWLDGDDDEDEDSPNRQRSHPQPSPPHQINNSNSNSNKLAAGAAAATAAAPMPRLDKTGISGSGGIAVASGRTLADIEALVEQTKNNSNQQQRYEMRGGHTVDICSQVNFPERCTRDVTVTVEATHSNGCHRVIMFKGLTAIKRPDLGPKVKDCRLRMDQIVMTRSNITNCEWQKSITMSYNSDFQVGTGDEKSRPL